LGVWVLEDGNWLRDTGEQLVLTGRRSRETKTGFGLNLVRVRCYRSRDGEKMNSSSWRINLLMGLFETIFKILERSRILGDRGKFTGKGWRSYPPHGRGSRKLGVGDEKMEVRNYFLWENIS